MSEIVCACGDIGANPCERCVYEGTVGGASDLIGSVVHASHTDLAARLAAAGQRVDETPLFQQPEMVARFLAKIRVDEGGCHLWTGAAYGTGYGKVMFAKPGQRPRQGHVKAHRFALAMKLGRWPDPCALHSCHVRLCVNPEHLREGTKKENTWDMINAGRSRLARFVPGPRPDERGPRPERRILSPLQVSEAIAASAAGESGRSIARRFGVSPSVVAKRLREAAR